METTRPTESSIRVAVLDDHAIIRDSLSSVFVPPEFELVVNTGDPEEFLRAVENDRGRAVGKAVAVIDLVLQAPGGADLADGVSIVERLRASRSPFLPLVMSASNDADIVHWCAQRGAQGFMRKALADLPSLRAAVRAVADGQRVFPFEPKTVTEPRHQVLARLSPREREVLELVAAGADNLKIGALLGITERTVKAHVAAIYRKVGVVENRVQLAGYARDLGVRPRHA